MKTCPRCLTFKCTDDFYRNRNKADGLNPWCKSCWNDYMRPRNHAYHQRERTWLKPKNLERQAAWRSENRERHNASKRRWYWRNVDRSREASAKRSLERRAAVKEPYRRIDVFERDGWMCGICGRRINRRLPSSDRLGASIDHIIPLSRGGHDVFSNVQASHLSCNKARQAKPLAA